MTTRPTEPADAPVPLAGTEQAADQSAKQQPPAESGAMDAIANVVDGVTDVASVAADILSIFE